MESSPRSGGAPFRALLNRHRADLVAVLLIFVAYTVTIWIAFNSTWVFALLTGAANTVPVALFASVARRIIIRHVVGRPSLVQVAWHASLCLAFSLACYWLVLVMLGAATSPSPWQFSVVPFLARGTAWQMLENVTTYALVAALSHLQAARSTSISPGAAATGQDVAKEPSRLLVRVGEELLPIDLDSIVCIEGADDYAEVSTLERKRLVSMTLTEFAQTLDPGKFIRVHRSRIVNLDYVDRAEPAGGGRLLLHMRNGATLSTSRTGAQQLKSLVI